MTERAQVACGSCTLCCRSGELILLTADDISPPGKPYLVQQIEHGGKSVFALAQLPGGACVYVSPDGCRIHDHAPAICKAFDCGALYAARTPRARALMESADDSGYVTQLMAQGRRVHRLRIGLGG